MQAPHFPNNRVNAGRIPKVNLAVLRKRKNKKSKNHTVPPAESLLPRYITFDPGVGAEDDYNKPR
jgi:hypothetical protein